MTLSCSSIGLYAVNQIAKVKGQYTKHKNIAYGSLERQKLDIFIPTNNSNPKPVIVFFHGGNWSYGSKEDYLFIAETFTKHGFVVVIPNYRLHPQVRFPSFIEDGAHAVSWVQKNILSHQGDSHKIYLMGHSAGAHIAAFLTLKHSYLKEAGGKATKLAGMVGLAGPYDFLPLKEDYLKTIFGPEERYPLSQPIHFANGQSAPLLLIHGQKDRTVLPKNTKNLTQAIQQAKGSAQALYYQDFAHISVVSYLSAPLRNRSTLLKDILKFLKK